MTGWQLLLIDAARWLQRWGVYAGCLVSAIALSAWFFSPVRAGLAARGDLPGWVPVEMVVYMVGLSVSGLTAALTAAYQWLVRTTNERIARAVLDALAEAMRRVDTRPAPTPDTVIPSPSPVPDPPGPVVFPRNVPN